MSNVYCIIDSIKMMDDEEEEEEAVFRAFVRKRCGRARRVHIF